MPSVKPKTFRIHQDTIAAVSDKADIVDIVSEHTVLRHSGRSYRGPCPIHKGSNKSALSVDDSKGVYHCHNCGSSGGAINFLMEVEGTSFAETVIDLAKRYGIEIKTENPQDAELIIKERSHREKLFDAMAKVARFYRQQLGGKALAYLQKRKISKETSEKFKIGYAPDGWDNLGELKIPTDILEELGLIIPRKEKTGFYDRFRDRLMIPICDTRGRVVGFSARSLGSDDGAKYINSPETELFKKGELLFGLDKAHEAITKNNEAIIVEGHLDAISLHQEGFGNAIASMGTALSAAQIKQVLRYTESKKIILNFDSDKAGIEATKKAVNPILDLVLEDVVDIRVLTLKGKKDADEYLTSYGADAYKQALREAPPYLDWLIELSLEGKNLKDSIEFQKANQAIAQILAPLPFNPKRSHYTHKCAQRLAQGDARLAVRIEEDLRRLARSPFRSEPTQNPRIPPSVLELAERQLLKAFLNHSDWRGYIVTAIASQDIEFSTDEHCTLWHKLLADEVFDIPHDLHEAIVGDVKAVVDRAIVKIQHIYCEKREKYWLELYRNAAIDNKPYFQTKIQQEGLRKAGLVKLMTISG